jgi:hypothetical protein
MITQRDFPEATLKNNYLGFVSDHIKSNLQQMVMNELEKHSQGCYDVRSREIKNQFPVDCDQRARLYVRVYRATQGTEFFLSVELPSKTAKCADDAILMGLLRLRFTDVDIRRIQGEEVRVPSHYMPEFAARPMARIRELHVYGNLRMVNPKNACNEDRLSQHTGVGKYLMAAAELISHTYGFHHIAVISGVGVRSYYAKLGYELDNGPGEFMIKNIASDSSLLPLVFFGTEHHPDRVLTPISEFTITKAHLPQTIKIANHQGEVSKKRGFGWARGLNLFSSGLATHAKSMTPWYQHHAYPNIQEGRAQLAVINVLGQNESSKSTPDISHSRPTVQHEDLQKGKHPRLNINVAEQPVSQRTEVADRAAPVAIVATASVLDSACSNTMSGNSRSRPGLANKAGCTIV